MHEKPINIKEELEKPLQKKLSRQEKRKQYRNTSGKNKYGFE
tara:strand:+ start:25300 stop:25425 length:126 start_codon:yes stop_codon:yes gene_type:complete